MDKEKLISTPKEKMIVGWNFLVPRHDNIKLIAKRAMMDAMVVAIFFDPAFRSGLQNNVAGLVFPTIVGAGMLYLNRMILPPEVQQTNKKQ